MGTHAIPIVGSQRCLGVQIDEKLSFENHIDKIKTKICSGIGVLRRIKPFVPIDCREILYKSLVQPYFDYCSPLWDTCSKSLKNKLQKLQNRAARVITGDKYDVRSVEILNRLKWDTLEIRRLKMKSTLVYKIVNENSAPNLRGNFSILKDTNKGNYNLRRLKTDLALPRPNTNFRKRSFGYSGAMLWNSLPTEVKTSSSLQQFKSNISTLPFTETC